MLAPDRPAPCQWRASGVWTLVDDTERPRLGDRLFAWGLPLAIVAIGVIGVALLLSVDHRRPAIAPAPPRAAPILMSVEAENALPAVQLGGGSGASAGPCRAPASRDRTGGPCTATAREALPPPAGRR